MNFSDEPWLSQGEAIDVRRAIIALALERRCEGYGQNVPDQKATLRNIGEAPDE